MRYTLLALPLAALVVAAIVAAVLLAWPWDDGSAVPQAAATPAEYGLCNVSVSNIPPGVEVVPFPFPAVEGLPGWDQPGPSGDLIFLQVRVPLPSGQRQTITETGEIEPPFSAALVDARTGRIATESYVNQAEEAVIKGGLPRSHVEVPRA
jgi:hypothetical protein